MSAFFINNNTSSPSITSSDLAFIYIHSMISTHQEEVWVLCLNSNKKPIRAQCIFKGSVDQCMIHPREIFYFIIKNLSSSFILFHSHPSGSTRPSKEDKKITFKLLKASKIMNIKMLDHIIITKNSYFSFLDNSLL